MQKNKELQGLFSQYKNLSEEQLDRLLGLVAKQEKERLGLELPIQLKIDYDELSDNNAGGDASLEYNEKSNRYEHVIRLSGIERYRQYLENRDKTSKLGDMTFENSLDSLYNLISQLCHEMRHAYQNECTQVKREISNPDALVWVKQAMVVGEDFYRANGNYANMPREVDAFNYQYKEALEYIKNYTNIEKDNPAFFETLEGTRQRWEKENVKPLEELTFSVNGETVKATDYLSENMEEALKNNPDITPSVIENSILRYEYHADGTKKTLEQLMADKGQMIDGLDKNLSNYHKQVQKLDRIYNEIIKNDINLQAQMQSDEPNRQLGYSREENGDVYIERQEQVLKEYSGKEIGRRTITWNSDIKAGTQEIETVGTMENDDGIYQLRETTKTIDEDLEQRRKEMTRDNKLTGAKEQSVFQKDGNGNEMYYKRVNGQIAFKITKTPRGVTIDNYDRGQLIDTYEYDENGKAIDGMGMPGVELLENDYVQNYFDAQVPYFVAENKELSAQNTTKRTVDTQKLGKETLEEQKDTASKDSVEKDMETQMINREGQKEPVELERRTDEKSFRSSMKFDVTPDMYEDVLRGHSEAEKNLEHENTEKGRTDQTENGDR